MHRLSPRARTALALFPLVIAACASETPSTDSSAAPGAVFNLPSPPQQSFALHKNDPQQSAGKPAATSVQRPAQRSVYYDLDRYEIKPEFVPAIEAHARYLRANPNARVTIQGNGDERGSREYNLALGQRRAEGVRKMMRVGGVSERQMEAVSFGEEKPRAAGHDEKSWAQNRRSDLVYE